MAQDADRATRERVARELDPELAERLSKGQPSKDEIIVRHATTIMRLRDLLGDCRTKLTFYRKAHSGEYLGGVEYSELMHRIDRELGILAKD